MDMIKFYIRFGNKRFQIFYYFRFEKLARNIVCDFRSVYEAYLVNLGILNGILESEQKIKFENFIVEITTFVMRRCRRS